MTFNPTSGSSGIIVVIMMLVLMSAGIIGFIMLSTQHNDAITTDTVNNTGVLTTGSFAYNLTNQTSSTIANNGGTAIFLVFMAFVVCISMIIITALGKRG